MAQNTPHNVTLSEAQISVILNSLDHTLDRWEQNGYHCEEDQLVNHRSDPMRVSLDRGSTYNHPSLFRWFLILLP